MEASTLHAKLKLVREKQDIKLPSTPYLIDKIKKRDGTEVEFSLRPYQRQMVIHLMAMKRFIVGDDTGLGKTVETIAALCQLWAKDPTKKVLILTKKSSVPQWESEFERFTNGIKVFVADGSPEQRSKVTIEWQDLEGPSVLIQGYASAAIDFTRLQHFSGYILICDEATAFKNPKTRTHKVCQHYSNQAERCWGLTATLIKNNLIEAYGIYRVVVPDLFRLTPQAFMNQYCIVQMQKVAKNRQVPKIVGYRQSQLDEFRDRTDLYYLGRPKHAVATDLPYLTTRDIRVGMTKYQREKYEEALTGLLEHGDGELREYHETAQLTALIYCQEIVDHLGMIGFEGYSSEKLDALIDLLSDGDFEGEKVIIFTRFTKMIDIGIEALKKAGIKSTRVTGAENIAERRAAMESFQDPKSDTSVIWISMAGGDAINLQAARALIFYDTPWSAGDYIQILGRMIRIGSEHDRVYALHLLCEDSIDERVQETIKKKMRLIQQVIGDRIQGTKGQDIVYESGGETKDLWNSMLSQAREIRRKKTGLEAEKPSEEPVASKKKLNLDFL